MAWDDTKSAFETRTAVPGDEKVTAAEWNNMVSDQQSRTTTSEDVENFATSGSDGHVPVAQSNGTLQMEAQTAQAWSQTTQMRDYTASNNDSVWADASSVSVTITLPPPSQSDHVRVLATDTTNGVTVSENGSEQINDQSGSQSTLSLKTGESLTLESDGSTWWVV